MRVVPQRAELGGKVSYGADVRGVVDGPGIDERRSDDIGACVVDMSAPTAPGPGVVVAQQCCPGWHRTVRQAAEHREPDLGARREPTSGPYGPAAWRCVAGHPPTLERTALVDAVGEFPRRGAVVDDNQLSCP